MPTTELPPIYESKLQVASSSLFKNLPSGCCPYSAGPCGPCGPCPTIPLGHVPQFHDSNLEFHSIPFHYSNLESTALLMLHFNAISEDFSCFCFQEFRSLTSSLLIPHGECSAVDPPPAHCTRRLIFLQFTA